MTRLRQPVFSVWVSDPGSQPGASIPVSMTVQDAAGSAVWSTNSPIPAKAGGQTVNWSGGSDLPDGDYLLSVQGGESHSVQYRFSVDTTPPPAPLVTSASPSLVADGYGTLTDANGMVGETAYQFTIGSSSRDVHAYIYSVAIPGLVSAPPGDLVCGQRALSFVMVCPEDGAPVTVTAGAVDDLTRLQAWSFDDAGNIAGPAIADFRVGNRAPFPSMAMNVSDAASGVSRTGITAWFDGPSGECATEEPSDFAPEGFQYSGGYSVGEGGAAVDPSRSFTASVWACPSTTAPATVLAQTDASGTNQFRLGIDASGRWALTTRSAAGVESTVRSVAGAAAGQWAFVNAEYDHPNGQMRISVSAGNSTETWVVSAVDPLAPSGSGTHVYLGKAGPHDPQAYDGLLVRPALTQGLLVPMQLQVLWWTTDVVQANQILY
ncbi:LamG-like jellyroll fold domain-containing protein [Sinomonas sp. JGH33]|uniref:LamG-like jellyroll fold domain-containing protein n=1 Tax=Sinomonas terricola TaxID=3110330 RepID=A0ABU5T4U8_9MICC|nr:LamG-like jellyroll fold domain-containing protein [Sinomonas sp. JGH33]MEA5454176.1 LamG-like jellyroll fold domain-containing protein [Sinomonas sp. JGH33]